METLGTYMQPFHDWLLRSTLHASIVVCLILLIQVILRNKLTARWHYALWLILVIRMVLPWAPQSGFSIFNFITWQSKSDAPNYTMSELSAVSPKASGESLVVQQTTITQEKDMQRDLTTVAVNSDVPSKPLSTELSSTVEGQEINVSDSPKVLQESADPATKPRLLLTGILSFFWLVGALVLAGYIIICNLKLWRAASVECPSTDKEILEILEECRSEIGLRTIIALVPSEKVNTPILLGFIRPRLLIPKSITKELTREELRYIFLHELAHVKRHDIALGWLTALLQVLHWFNPLIWLAFHRMRSNRELACDALVLSRTQDEGTQNYGKAIVSLLEHFSIPQPLPGLAGILESKSQLKRRIAMITQFKKNSYQWSPLVVILIITLGCVSLFDPISTEASRGLNIKATPGVTLRRVMEASSRLSEISKDGKYFCSVGYGDLRVHELATGQKKVLVPSGINQAVPSIAISPDSRMVAYYWHDGENDTINLQVIGLDGAGRRTLVSSKVNTSPTIFPRDWSNDGKWILGLRPLGDIVLVSTEDGSVDTVTSLSNDRFLLSSRLALSPDNQYIAYEAKDPQGLDKYDIFLFDMDKKSETALQHPADDRLFGWTPDGKHILFVSDRSGTWDIWILQVSEGKPLGLPEVIRPDIGAIDPIGLTQEGACFYGTIHSRTTIFTAMVDLDTGKVLSSPEPLQPNPKGCRCLVWSPDGKYLAYLQSGSGESSNIHIRSHSTGMERVIETKLPMVMQLSWSHDGKSLIASWIVPGAGGGGIGGDYTRSVYLINVETGEKSVLFKSDVGAPRRAEIFPDGKSLVYTARDSMFIRDLETGQERNIFKKSSESRFWTKWDLAPDGNSIVVDSADVGSGSPSELKIISLEGKVLKELLLEDWGEISDISWAPDGQSLLFTSDEKLWQIASSGGQPRELMAIPDEYNLHPDGRRIAYSTGESDKEIWVMENFCH